MTVQRPTQYRMRVVLGFLTLGFVAFLAKAFTLQIVDAADNLDRAQWRDATVTEHEAPRGPIVDRDGHLLAESAAAVKLWFDPVVLLSSDREHMDVLISEFARFERFDAEELNRWAAGPLEGVPRYRLLSQAMAPPEAQAMRTRLAPLGIRSVVYSDAYRRVYPGGPVAGRILGFMDARSTLGVAGLEAAYEDVLAGGSVEVRVARDRAREPFLLDDIPNLQDAAGATVELTLDLELQEVVEQSLQATLTQFRAESGTVVVTRVETGEILAMASLPSFNREETLFGDGDGWRNPAIANAVEPGSTVKIFTFAAGVEEDVIGYNSTLDCNRGVVMLDGFPIRDSHCPDTIEAWEVIRDSSNIGALRIGMRMSQATHREYLEAFGFGSPTGVPLPAETGGQLRPLPWPQSVHATTSYGYGFSVSPLQLNMATAAIANGGMLMHPLLVRRVVSATGEMLEENTPQPVRRVISARTASLATQAMETVIARDSTGVLAAVPGYSVAGKTGTARLVAAGGGGYEDAHRALFTGFVPSDAPRFAITVLVERPDPSVGTSGGVVAAPLFSMVARRALELDGLPVESATGTPQPVEHMALEEVSQGIEAIAPVPEDVNVRTVPDFVGLHVRQALIRASREGVEIAVEGTGDVAEQWPPAGAAATPGMSVVLTLESVLP